MTFSKKLYVSILLGLAMPSLALAAGLGRMTVNSALGQPLRAEIEVVALQPGEADTMAAALAPVASFRQANVEYTSALQSIRFAIDRRPNNQYVISLSSTEPMNEPFLDMLVELTWSAGRLVREYTFLLDPPELKPAVAVPTPPVTPPVVAPLAQEPARPAAAPAAPAAATESRQAAAAPAAPKPAARPAAKPAGQYEVKRGDTLARIASQNMVAGSTLQQMLAALYRGNEDAFDGKNMNRLRTGKILNLPGAEDVQGISQGAAIEMVRSQASEYAEYQRSIGAAVAAAPERAAGSRQASGKITAPAADKPAPKGAAKDQVRLSKPDDAKAGGRAAAAASADDAAAKDKALREAQERVALLEKNVQDLQKLLQLKSGSGAQAQKQAEAVKAPAAEAKAEPPKPAAPAAKAEAAKAPAEPAKPAPEPAKAAEAPKSDTPDASKAEAPDASKAGEPAKPAAEGGAAPDTAKAAPKPAPKAPPPPPPPPPDLVDQLLDNELALGGGAAVILLLGGYAAYAWRKKKKAASAEFGDSVMDDAPAAAPSIASNAMPDSEPVSTSAETSQGASSGGGEEIDPIAEADVYMAYGRDAQAEEILKEALAKDVNRTPVWVKLLEVYANRKDLAAFESTAKDLQTLTGGQGPEWEKAVALGLQLDPGNALYGGSGGETAGALDLGSTQILSGAEFAEAGDATVIPDAAAAAPAVDFDLDLGDAPAQESAGSAIDLDLGAEAPGEAAAEESAGSGLDFDLGLDSDKPAEEAPSDFTPQGTLIMDSTVAPAAETVSAPEEGGASIDFDLGMPDDAPAEAPAAPAADAAPVVTEDAGSTLDFDLNLDDEPAAAPAEPAAPATADIDLSALSLDLGTDDAAPAGAPMDAKWQEVATKLDLAKAYDEMGDKDGARDLLNEVMQEGDAAQKQQAQTMIDALG